MAQKNEFGSNKMLELLRTCITILILSVQFERGSKGGHGIVKPRDMRNPLSLCPITCGKQKYENIIGGEENISFSQSQYDDVVCVIIA